MELVKDKDTEGSVEREVRKDGSVSSVVIGVPPAVARGLGVRDGKRV